jgi:hypothetical protein
MTRLFWILLVFAALSGCVAGQEKAAVPLAAGLDGDYENEDDADWASPQDPAVGDMFLKFADTALGTPYIRGGAGMSGFDCSGFVQWTYRNMGIELPRTAREQSQVGRAVAYHDLRIGDIVTFRHPRRGWHSGIYAGDDRFVHSPSRRQRVRYSSMSDPYFRANFVVARRVVEGNAALDIEAASRRLVVAENEKRVWADEPVRISGKGKGKQAGGKAGTSGREYRQGKSQVGKKSGKDSGKKSGKESGKDFGKSTGKKNSSRKR